MEEAWDPEFPSAGNNQRYKERQHDGLAYLSFKKAHGRCREHFSQKQDYQPAGALFYKSAKTDGRVWFIQCFGTPDFLDLPGIFFFRQPEYIIEGNNAEQDTGFIDHGQGKAAVVAEKSDNFILRIVGVDRDKLVVHQFFHRGGRIHD